MIDGYWLVGFQYEVTGTLYSMGRIPKCKVAMLKHLKPGDKVLIAGVGHGTEAIEASKLGAQVTAVDLSATMLQHFQRRIDKAHPPTPIRLVHDNIFNVSETEQYDMVIANFFLNVFDEQTVPKVAKHLSALVKPGGYFVAGDFMLPEKGWRGLLQRLNWYFAIGFYSITTEAAFHPVWNYAGLVEQSGCKVQEIEYFRILGLKLYWSILGKKPAR